MKSSLCEINKKRQLIYLTCKTYMKLKSNHRCHNFYTLLILVCLHPNVSHFSQQNKNFQNLMNQFGNHENIEFKKNTRWRYFHTLLVSQHRRPFNWSVSSFHKTDQFFQKISFFFRVFLTEKCQ